MRAAAALVGLVLHWTNPISEVSSTGCGDWPAPLSAGQLVATRVYTLRQSQTWIDSSSVLLSSSAGFSRLWPIVRREASPAIVRTKAAIAGAVDTCAVPAGPWLAGYVVAVKSNGRESCPVSVPIAPATPATRAPARVTDLRVVPRVR